MIWLDGIADAMDEFDYAPGVGDGQGAWHAAILRGLLRVGHDSVTELN